MNIQTYAEAVSELNEELQRVRKINSELLDALRRIADGFSVPMVGDDVRAGVMSMTKREAKRIALAAIAKAAA